MNEDVQLPFEDPVLPGKTVTSRLEPDHIVSVDKISRMEGLDKLTEKQQLEVLNNEENFIGLSRAANGSKQDKSFEEWTHYKKGKEGEIEVDPEFREEMMKKEKEIERNLQKQIDDFIEQNKKNNKKGED